MKEYLLEDDIGEKIIFRIGQNAKENHQLIDNADKDDWWFHLSEYSSCHCIVEKIDISKIEILYAATLVKDNSKYINSKKVKICYTQVKNIKKTKNPGEVMFLKQPNIITI
jgi:predicted ribosome quality control (RQC) complex YloA/Tae2 family protein